MSLILDALRKSEAERRRGQAPDLFAPVATSTMVRGKPPLALIAVALAAMAAAAIIVFWPTQPVPQPVPDVAGEATGAQAGTMPAASAVAAPAASPITTAPVATPVVDDATASLRQRAPPPEIHEKSVPVAQGAVTPRPVPALSETVPAAINNDAGNPPTVDNDDLAPASTEPPLPTLATLDSAARAALPPLQLSMHVWNPDASRRFAIIDGQRLGEGGKLAGAVVAQIRRDGVVLEIDGRQYLLPRP